MNKAEVQALSDENLKKEWEVIKAVFKSSLPQNLSAHQSLIFFADFVNVSQEMGKRKISTD